MIHKCACSNEKTEKMRKKVKSQMGAYYGVKNYSKKHNVSSYWKGSPPDVSELLRIAELLGWEMKSDDVRSYSYERGYWYNSKSESWCDLDIEDDTDNENEWSSYGFDGENVCEFDDTFFCN